MHIHLLNNNQSHVSAIKNAPYVSKAPVDAENPPTEVSAHTRLKVE